MKKIDRIKELEKIAEKLGIGQNREVKCVACKKKIKFKNAIILTNKKKVTYLCKKCYKQLEAGELNKKQIESDDVLKQLEKLRKEEVKIPPYKKIVPWEPYTPEPIELPKPVKWDIPEQIRRETTGEQYYVSSLTDKNAKEILKIEPTGSTHDDKAGGSA